VTTTSDGRASTTGPTVLRIMLGNQLRKLREARGVSREEAGYEIRASGSKISRMELGRVGFKERDVADLLTLYRVVDQTERAALLALAREANNPGWWHRYGDVLPNWFQSYLGLEAAASLIRSYELQFVPGLLQTPDYARAVILLGHGHAPAEEIERRVVLRMSRQKILTRPDAPQLWAVIDEAVLRRPIGGPAVLRAQLQALIDASQLPNVTIQVISFAAGGHAAAGGAFTLLRFPDQELPDVVYLEQLTSALYLDKREDVDHYAAAMERLCIEADPPARTVEILTDALRELDGEPT
jgi:transcriptional regulator with XRE-family HTH domain